MRKYFLWLSPMLLLFCNFSSAQSFQKSFVIANKEVFNVSFYTDSINIITVKTLYLTNNVADSNKINNIDKQIFKTIVTSQIAQLLDSIYVITNSAEIDKTLDKAFDDYTSQVALESKKKDELELKFGRDEYYGLDSLQKDALLNKLALIRIRQQELFKMKKRFGFASDTSKFNSLEKDIKNLNREIRDLKSYRQFQVSLIGNANVISSFKIANQSQINGGFGIIVSKPNHIEFLGVFTISQANDTISSIGKSSEDFGTSILIPGVRKFSLLTSFRQRQLWPTSYSNFWNKIGIAWNVNITPYNWAIRKTDNSSDSITAKLTPVAMDLMFPFNWVNIYKDGQDINVSTDFGFTARYLMGNIDADKRKVFLNNNPYFFYGGVIAGINIKFNGLRFQFHAPLLFGSHVDGLTGGQAYASMTFITTIVGSNPKSLFKTQ
jgi:hypothetical protein